MPLICYVPKSFRPDTQTRINQANEIIVEYQAQGFKLTLRQLYYQFVSRDLIPNTVQSYKSLGDVVNDGRLAGLIDWDAIEDRTRNLRSGSHWSSPRSIVRACADQYAVDLWATQENYVECWIEKDALVGVIEGVCNELDVPYFACRGYTSQSEMWGAAQRLVERERRDKKTSIIHLGDHDPSGIDMTRDIQDRLQLFGSTAVIHRIALNFDQVKNYNPPPNPAKTTDSPYQSYADRFGEESWELDALEPRTIVDLIRNEIEAHIDQDAWEEASARQQTGRDQLGKVSRRWDNVVTYLGNGDSREQ
jgi:hypothetical protein